MGSAAVSITPDAAASPQGVTITPDPPKKTTMQSVEDFAKEWWNQVNPVTAVTGARDMVNHPIDTASNMADSQAALAYKAKDAFQKGNYAEGVRHALNYMLPIIGSQTDRAGDLLDQGKYAAGAGATAGIATNIAAPEAITRVGGIPGMKSALQSTSERMYQSAIKPPPSMPSADVGNIVNTGLKEGIPVSDSGVAKISALVDGLNNEIKAKIAAGAKAGQTVDPAAVASRVDQARGKFAKQVNPNADLAALDASKQEFLQNNSTPPASGAGPSNVKPIPVDEAQGMKQGTYRQLSAKVYGEMGTATTEAQKALARGIKEELETQFPEIKGLNAREGKLLDLDEVLQRAVNRTANHNLLPVSPILTGVGTTALSGSTPLGLAAIAIKSALADPNITSRLAVAISKGSGVTMSMAKARVAAYSAALANAATSSSRDGQASANTN